MRADWRQVSILHLSDLHFHAGSAHRFRPMATPAGDIPEEDGFPSLAESLKADLARRRRGHPVVVAVTGDLTQTAATKEFDAAGRFLQALTSAPVLGQDVTSGEVFVVPGNHDVVWKKKGEERWKPYCEFRRQFLGEEINPSGPDDLTRVHDRSKDLGMLLVEVNSCAFVEKGTKDAQRGRVSTAALARLDDALAKLDTAKAIKVALMHHHPVLLPVFAEAGRGYDSIVYGGQLLAVLRKHGFHVVLHGHKHHPFSFSYDASSAWGSFTPPTLILAGGSASGTELPRTGERACNTYNEVTIKWHPAAREGRVRVVTRRLQVCGDDGEELLPQKWRWSDLRTSYHPLKAAPRAPRAGRTTTMPFRMGSGAVSEQRRRREYERLRGNMPVVDVVSSMDSQQGYDARVWIEPHSRLPKNVPVEVVWSGGPRFRLVHCAADENPNFSTTFSFYGPMLLQARMTFSDGRTASGYVYVCMPGQNR